MRLEWSTEEVAKATILYGPTASMEFQTSTQLLLYDHGSVGALQPDTTYFLRLLSEDSQGNVSAPVDTG